MWIRIGILIWNLTSLKSIEFSWNDDDLYKIKAVKFIIKIRWGIKSQPLVGKIGIHYGRAISGVIGFHKP